MATRHMGRGGLRQDPVPDRSHAFAKAESAWLSGTLRLLKNRQGRPASTRRRGPPPADALPPPPPAKPAPRDSLKAHRRQHASPKTPDTDPVRSASRYLNYILTIYPVYDIHTLYDIHSCVGVIISIMSFISIMTIKYYYHILTLHIFFMSYALFTVYYLFTL